jgi:hypothetical protein
MGPPSANLWEAPYQKGITTTTDWQRVSWTVKLPFVAEGFYLAQLTTHDAGEFWVDGAQVEVGAQATTFRRTAQTEMALLPQKNFGLHRAGEALALSPPFTAMCPPARRSKASCSTSKTASTRLRQ